MSRIRQPAGDHHETLIFPGTAGLTVYRTIDYRCARLVLAGAIDGRTAPWLAEQLAVACLVREVDAIAVEMRQVTFLGAAGLRCLDAIARLGLRHDKRLSVWGARPFLRRVLESGDLHPSILLEPPTPAETDRPDGRPAGGQA